MACAIMFRSIQFTGELRVKTISVEQALQSDLLTEGTKEAIASAARVLQFLLTWHLGHSAPEVCLSLKESIRPVRTEALALDYSN